MLREDGVGSEGSLDHDDWRPKSRGAAPARSSVGELQTPMSPRAQRERGWSSGWKIAGLRLRCDCSGRRVFGPRRREWVLDRGKDALGCLSHDRGRRRRRGPTEAGEVKSLSSLRDKTWKARKLEQAGWIGDETASASRGKTLRTGCLRHLMIARGRMKTRQGTS